MVSSVPSLYILYPVTPVSSVDAVQLSEIEDDESAVAERLVGVDGGVVSVDTEATENSIE